MYQVVNKTTGESETMTEREAVNKYGTDKVNAMMFDMDPDMSLSDMDTDVEDLHETYGGDYL